MTLRKQKRNHGNSDELATDAFPAPFKGPVYSLDKSDLAKGVLLTAGFTFGLNMLMSNFSGVPANEIPVEYRYPAVNEEVYNTPPARETLAQALSRIKTPNLENFEKPSYENIESSFYDFLRGNPVEKLQQGAQKLADNQVPLDKQLKGLSLPDNVGLSVETPGGQTKLTLDEIKQGSFEKDGQTYKIDADTKVHEVRQGDTLWDFAGNKYGDPYAWNLLAQQNESNIASPDSLEVGDKIQYFEFTANPVTKLAAKDASSESDVKTNSTASILKKPGYIDTPEEIKSVKHSQLMQKVAEVIEPPEVATHENIEALYEKLNARYAKYDNPVLLEQILEDDQEGLDEKNPIPYLNMVDYVESLGTKQDKWVSVPVNFKQNIILHHLGDDFTNPTFNNIYNRLEQSLDTTGTSTINGIAYSNLLKKVIKSTVDETSSRDYGRTGCPYHFMITPDGTVVQTNSLDKKAYAVHYEGGSVSNTNSVHICVIGNYENGSPDANVYSSIAALTSYLKSNENLNFDNDVIGHREVNQTLCPGKHIEENLDEINQYASYLSEHPEKRTRIAKSTPHELVDWIEDNYLAKRNSYQDWSADRVPADAGDTEKVSVYKPAEILPEQAEATISDVTNTFSKLHQKEPNKNQRLFSAAMYTTFVGDLDQKDENCMESICRVIGNPELLQKAQQNGDSPIERIAAYTDFYLNGNEEPDEKPYIKNSEQFKSAFTKNYQQFADLGASV